MSELIECLDGLTAKQILKRIAKNGQPFYLQSKGLGSAPVPPVADFFVANDGDDLNDGRSVDTPWKTVGKVTSETFMPGEIIAFKKGDTWREQLTVPNSGNAANYIEFTSYGSGDNPKFLGSEKGTGWVNVVGNIWSATGVFLNPMAIDNGMEIWFEETDGSVSWGDNQVYDAPFTNLTAEYDWTWNAGTIYVYSPADPGTRYSSVEIGQRASCIEMNDEEYIEIDGIDMFYTVWCVNGEYPQAGHTGFIMRNLESAYTGYKNGTSSASSICYNDSLFENLTSHDHGRRGLSIINYGATDISNIIVQDCLFYNGFHTTGPDVETGGAGGATGNIVDLIIRRCLIFDEEDRPSIVSELIFLQGPHGDTGQIIDAKIYNNILKFPSNRAIGVEDVDGLDIYHNTIYGHNNQIATNTFQIGVTDGSTDIMIKNNIFYTLLGSDAGDTGIALYETASQSFAEIDADYNLYYRLVGTIITGDGNEYVQGQFEAMKTALGWEANSPAPDDPLFTNELVNNFHLRTGSPAIGAGVAIAGYTTDYDGIAVSNPPNIGAFETVEDPTHTYNVFYQLVYNYYTNKPLAATAAIWNTFVAGLVSDGVWPKIDVLWNFAAHSNADGEALVNWIKPGYYLATLVNAPAFTANQGFTGNGTNSYINCHWDPYASGRRYVLDSASLGAYFRVNVGEAKRPLAIREADDRHTEIISKWSDGNAYFWVNSQTSGGVANADARGMYIANRTASNVVDLYKNKVAIINDNDASTNVPNDVLFALARSDGGTSTPVDFSTQQVSLVFAGSELTTDDIDSITDRYETAMDALGTGVIP